MIVMKLAELGELLYDLENFEGELDYTVCFQHNNINYYSLDLKVDTEKKAIIFFLKEG